MSAPSLQSVSQRTLRDASAQGSRFEDVWRALSADPYRELPQRRVRFRDLPTWLSGRLLHDAERTLRESADLLPPFEKLVHPVGIALRGIWRIHEPTPYGGYFSQGSQGLIIARASDATGEHRPGKLRFMGMAGKIYPTLAADHREPLRTANFFTLENLAGSHTRFFAHASFVTDLLGARPHADALGKAPLGAAAAALFARADRTLNVLRPSVRQLYPIAELGGVPRASSRAPTAMRLLGESSNPYVESADLREELARAIEPDGLRFRIEVASEPSRFVPKRWQTIGEISFTEAVASYDVDHRLHFAHPPYRHE